MNKLTLLLGGLCTGLAGLIIPACAQTDLPRLPLSSLNRPANWQSASGLTATLDQNQLKGKGGSDTLLIGAGNAPLTLVTPASDFSLQFEVLMPPRADAWLTLPNGETIKLAQTREVTPLLKTAGLWQTVRLDYQTGSGQLGPILEKLVVNGVTVQEGQRLQRSTTNQPVQLTAQNGSIALRKIGYRALDKRTVATWAGPLTYTLYGESLNNRESLQNRKPVKTDTVSRISYDVSYGQPRQFAVLFTGKLNVPATGLYQLDLVSGGAAGLWVDGKNVVPVDFRDLGPGESRTLNLTAGTHAVEVMYSRYWQRPGVGLYISRAGTRPQALHTDGSVPEFSPPGQVIVQPEARPTMIRSFVQMPGERNKRTKALSVGTGAGMHYTVDLSQMALLMAWKGDFADVTEMWYERGEPQLLAPMGAVVRPAPRPAIAPLADANAAWPDSLTENVLTYNGLTLNKEGYPMMDYSLAGVAVRESLLPTANKLERTFTLTGNAPAQPLYCRLAAAKTIEEVAKGLYAIDDRSYYVRLDPKAKATIRQQGGQQELMLPVSLRNGSETVQYSLEF